MTSTNIRNQQKKIRVDPLLRQAVRDVIRETVARGNLSGNYQADVLLTDDTGIRLLNRKYRHLDQPTDVLSFEMGETDPETGDILWGNIAVSLETAARQALACGHTLHREVAFLVSHGAVHLLGYDHPDETALQKMVSLQETILDAAGFSRDLDIVLKDMLKEALEAMKRAYAPYSRFHVGACAVTADNHRYSGSNVENISSGATLCAERTAIGKAVSDGAREIILLMVCGDAEEPVLPCGICLQTIAEFAPPEALIICGNRTGDRLSRFRLSELLPHRFGGYDP